MNCNQIRELLPELAAGMDATKPEPEVEKHIASCAACAAQLQEFQKTMALLDEWQAPEPGWLSWMRRPAWAMSLAAMVFAGALTIGVGSRSYFAPLEAIKTDPPALGLPVQPGTAVGDLQALDRNDELFADFDVLDQLQLQDDVTANP